MSKGNEALKADVGRLFCKVLAAAPHLLAAVGVKPADTILCGLARCNPERKLSSFPRRPRQSSGTRNNCSTTALHGSIVSESCGDLSERHAVTF